MCHINTFIHKPAANNYGVGLRMEEIVRDKELVGQCRECCNEDIDESVKAKVCLMTIDVFISWSHAVRPIVVAKCSMLHDFYNLCYRPHLRTFLFALAS